MANKYDPFAILKKLYTKECQNNPTDSPWQSWQRVAVELEAEDPQEIDEAWAEYQAENKRRIGTRRFKKRRINQ